MQPIQLLGVSLCVRLCVSLNVRVCVCLTTTYCCFDTQPAGLGAYKDTHPHPLALALAQPHRHLT